MEPNVNYLGMLNLLRQLLERELLQREEAIKIAARLKVETGASIVTFL